MDSAHLRKKFTDSWSSAAGDKTGYAVISQKCTNPTGCGTNYRIQPITQQKNKDQFYRRYGCQVCLTECTNA